MAKEDIFSKINLKDYNNILENILEQKDFSRDVKSLLLSMLYKIENGYEDYETVKVNVSNKKYFLKKIIQIIQEQCNEIELIKPLTQESKILEENNVNYIVEKEKGKIIVYPNERIILEALVTLKQKEIDVKEDYKLYRFGLEEILQKGNRMSIVEVIRDFNGWSWDITTSQMENKNCNIIYQNLAILLGNTFLQSFIMGEENREEEIDLPNNEILRSKYNNSFGMTKEEMQKESKIDYMQKMKEILEEKYGKENAELFFTQFIKTVIAIGCNKNKMQKDIILEKQAKIIEELERMQNNKEYLENISKSKKELTKEIKRIDTLLSDEKLLKQEYNERNSKLPNREKIFSVSHLRIMIEKERKKHLEKIKQLNMQMEPKEFVKTKKFLEEKAEFFKQIEAEKEKRVPEEKQIEYLQICFLSCFLQKIKRAQTKKEVQNLLYELRYYEQLPYKNDKIVSIDKIQEQIKKVETILIKKACNEKILTKFSEQEEINNRILQNQFQSKIIKLENTIYRLKYHKGILFIEIYDADIEEEIKEIPIMQKAELSVKLNKKIKVWE